jgi:hypothetical protein
VVRTTTESAPPPHTHTVREMRKIIIALQEKKKNTMFKLRYHEDQTTGLVAQCDVCGKLINDAPTRVAYCRQTDRCGCSALVRRCSTEHGTAMLLFCCQFLPLNYHE